MPRKKIYQAVAATRPAFDGASLIPNALLKQEHGARSPSDADINLEKLLGPEARLAGPQRTIILSRALGAGIDEWVFAGADAIRARLLAGASTATGKTSAAQLFRFFEFLTFGATVDGIARSRPAKPWELKPIHITEFVAWLRMRAVVNGWASRTTRAFYQSVKYLLLAMFDLGLIRGDAHLYFKRGIFGRDGESNVTSLSDAEQERLAGAIKSDLSAIHHGRLEVTMREKQALRLLVVAHRMGHNLTPLLELRRDEMKPGLLPGTVILYTTKYRSKKVNSQTGLVETAANIKIALTDAAGIPNAAEGKTVLEGEETQAIHDQDYLPFGLREGAVIAQAIASSADLVARAPKRIQDRVWLYEISWNAGANAKKGDVSALNSESLIYSIQTIVKRHKLIGDDGEKLVVNLSRLRKSRFDRAFRITDGDLALTANLMGNTPQVVASDYPSMNAARQAEAAEFMNEGYIEMMRNAGRSSLRLTEIKPASEVGVPTPVAGCGDVLGGEHAPKDGNPCDRFVMCLFCSSFAIVGTVDELWRLFSFQAFARAELEYLENHLGPKPEMELELETQVGELYDLRDRYRLAIPYIDNFSSRQFAAARVVLARAKTATGLHPFWNAQIAASRSGRSSGLS